MIIMFQVGVLIRLEGSNEVLNYFFSGSGNFSNSKSYVSG